MAKRHQTRGSVRCPIFDYGENLEHRQRPFFNVMKYYLYVRQTLKQETNEDPPVQCHKTCWWKTQNDMDECLYSNSF